MDYEERQCINKNKSWKILIVDDDNFIHRMLKEVNKNLRFEGKDIEFYSAYNSSEAMDIFKNNKDIGLVLLDVFLEEEQSGLDIVKIIREDLLNIDTRIVLMTGKSSNSLEDDIIVNYDINGYENKDDLFTKKMNTVIISSLRSYRDIIHIKNNKGSMEKVVTSISKLYEKTALDEFLMSTLCHLSSVINNCKCRKECVVSSLVATREEETQVFNIIGGMGKYKNSINRRMSQTIGKEDLKKAYEIFDKGEYRMFDNCYIAKYQSSTGNEAMIFIERDKEIEDADKELLDVFYKSISATFDNLCLNLEIEATQKEILYTLGEVTEARSEETGSHVKRVSKYSEILAEKYGLSRKDIMLLSHASPIHDIGKVAVPDNILLKAGKFTAEEHIIMKTHTTVGYNLLKNSKREILRAAAIVANEHHERYDGRGYPRGLKGEEIHIYGRITAVADVFDALGSPRAYKKPWVINDILKYFREERGKHFDPDLVDILFENLEEFLEIREKYADKTESVFVREENIGSNF